MLTGKDGIFLSFQFGPKLLQRPFFNAGYIAAANPCDFRHFPLALRRLAVQAIAQQDHLSLLFRQAGIYGPAQLHHHLPGGNLLQKVAVLADHIHQRQRRAIGTGLYVIEQGYILGTFALGAEVHQDFIFHTPGGIGGQPCPFGGVKGGDSLDESDGTDGNQVLLVGGLGVVFFARLMLAEDFLGL